MKKRRKIGILGGTFDPVHEGHLAVARKVLERYQLDKIVFIPAAAPPHKERKLTPFMHRFAMLEAALADEKQMVVSPLEAERNKPSYTVDTLVELHRRMPSCHFHLIMGADMFVEIELWYSYENLFELADIIIAARPGISPGMITERIARLPGGFTHNTAQKRWERDDGATVWYCEDVSEHVSSSAIRRRLAGGTPVEKYLKLKVLEYIKRHDLYTCSGHPQ